MFEKLFASKEPYSFKGNNFGIPGTFKPVKHFYYLVCMANGLQIPG
jgi:hypothetical protein